MPGYPEKIKQTIEDANLQLAIYGSTRRLQLKRQAAIAPDILPEYQELRDQASAIKKHTLENLDFYLEKLEAGILARGGKVIYCRDAAEVVDFLLRLAKDKGARLMVKSKSMTTEEMNLNERLEAADLQVVETDLGEFIIQLAGHRPYHIVAPALHLTRFDVADVFVSKLGVERETEIEKQTMIARRVLRDKFLSADIGVTGANFLVADPAAVVLVENEGNIRLTTSAPRVHVAVAGIEKLIPRAADLAVFLKLLGRSGTGQALSVYTSYLSGPRRPDETDGPEEFYLLVLDNGRSRLLADTGKRESLQCIRCGACLNICPVYRKVGGHAYPWVYSGPIGAIISPQFLGITHDPWLPFASSLCGACADVCPVKIDIPGLLLKLRSEVNRAKDREGRGRLERLGFRVWAWAMRNPKVYELAGLAASMLTADGGAAWLRSLPGLLSVGPAKAWASQRDLPAVPARSFRQLWRLRQAKGPK